MLWLNSMQLPNNPRPDVSLPTQEEIIELYGLIQQITTSARDVNFPLRFAFTYIASTVIRNLLIHSPIMPVLMDTAENNLGFLCLLGATIYQRYKLYERASALASYIFPQGVGIKKTLSASLDSQKILTAAEVRKLLPQLKELVKLQQSRAAKNQYLSLAASLILPLANAIQWLPTPEGTYVFSIASFNLGLNIGLWGPYISLVNNESPPLLPAFVTDMACAQQSASFLKYFYKKYSKRKVEYYKSTFLQSLDRLSGLNHQWQKVDNVSRYGKDTAMFSLKIPDQITSFQNELGKRCEVSSAFYISILHRSLLDAGLSVYILADNFLLVGFGDLTQRTTDKCRKNVLRQLDEIIELEETCRINLTRLNQKIAGAINLKLNAWQPHYEYDSATKHYTLCYFINKKHIPSFMLEDFLIFLKKITPSDCVNEYENSITLTKLPKQIDNLNGLIDRLQRNYKAKLAEDSYTAPMVRDSGPLRTPKAKHETKKTVPEDKSTPTQSSAVNIYPPKIKFKSGYTFFQPALGQKPAKFAYPLHLPWLPEGRAYACIDPKVFKMVEAMLSEKAILAQLEHGSLHSVREGFGIQTKSETYKATDGNYYSSTLQMKFGNNIGIFAHRLQRLNVGGNNYELHEFNGPGYRH